MSPLISLMLTWLLNCGPCAGGAAGKLEVLTYNVAGLPEGFSGLLPTRTLPQIGSKLDVYDLVLVQEDFAYPELLRQKVSLTYASAPHTPSGDGSYGDGLAFFSRFPFTTPTRFAWLACNGVLDSYFDCLTRKGYAVTTLVLSAGLRLHVYNAHLDAGWSLPDRHARESQITQLLRALNDHSSGEAVILGGDFNFSPAERDVLARFERDSGLVDVCKHLNCSQPDRIDRVLVRSSDNVRLKPSRWRIDTRFRDQRGRALSDHLAVAVQIEWAYKSYDSSAMFTFSQRAEQALPRSPTTGDTRQRIPPVASQLHN